MATRSQTLIAKGVQAGKRRNWEEAIDFLLQSLRVDPHNSEALFLVGAAYHQMGRKDRAEQYMRRSLELDPHLNAAKVYLERGVKTPNASLQPLSSDSAQTQEAPSSIGTDNPVLLGAFAGEVEEPGVGSLLPFCLIAAVACSLLLCWYIVS